MSRNDGTPRDLAREIAARIAAAFDVATKFPERGSKRRKFATRLQILLGGLSSDTTLDDLRRWIGASPARGRRIKGIDDLIICGNAGCSFLVYGELRTWDTVQNETIAWMKHAIEAEEVFLANLQRA